MIKRLNLNDINTVKDLLELQVASYIKEAEIIGFYDIPPLKDTVDSLKESKEIFYGYYVDNVLAGMISYKIRSTIIYWIYIGLQSIQNFLGRVLHKNL